MLFLLSILLLAPTDSLLQSPDPMSQHVSSFEEDFMEYLLDEQPEEYEELLTERQHLAENPINLNTATEEELQQIGLLDAWQIEALLHYRDSYGRILRIEELKENIPAFHSLNLDILRPFVCLQAESNATLPSLKQIMQRGKHRISARYGRVLKESKAFREHKYAGSPNNYCLRYSFDFQNRIRIGLAAKQGAGEAFGRQGFDSYSGYMALNGFGPIQNLVVGHYKADFGYGLNVHSPGGFYGGMQADLLSCGGKGIRPYASGAEYGYLQGAALRLSLPKQWNGSLFYSANRHDAGLESGFLGNKADFWDYIKSFPENGNHRTGTEIANKKTALIQIFGGMIEKRRNSTRIGMVVSGYLLGGRYTPEIKTAPFSPFSYSKIKAARGANLSLYYQWLRRHFHFFGEAAISHQAQTALLQGIQYKPAETFALAVQYTWQSNGYYAPYNTLSVLRPPRPAYSGTQRHLLEWQGNVLLPARLQLRFAGKESIERKNAGIPFCSHLFMATLAYESRNLSVCLRFKTDKSKSRSGNSLRLNAKYATANGFSGESRIELRNFHKGVLLLQDLAYSSQTAKLRARLRIALFHTDGYPNRIYAYEHDIRYAASSPALYGKGMRFCLLLSKTFGPVTLELKYAHTLLDGTRTSGSGDNMIDSFLKPEIKLQLHGRF